MTRVALLRVLLAALLLVPSTSADSPVGKEDHPVTINTLSVYKGLGQSIGLTEKVKVWYDQTDDSRTRIAFIEDEIDGYGEMWRGATWQASLVAADLCGRNLAGTRIFLERSGRVDGPSAGAITTVGVLAALRGDTVRGDVAMTGTINPDGTIGPVGGVPQKIDGAALAGMKMVLVPYGMRNDWDSVAEKQVDLVERGEQRGVEVRLVGDIYTAYKLCTGVELPRAAPAAAPVLKNSVYQRVKLKVDEWRMRYNEQLGEYKEVPSIYRSDYTDGLVEDAAEWMKEVDDLIAEGQAPTAYNDVVDATYNVAMASQVGRAIWVYEQRGLDDAVKYAQNFAQLPAKLRLATNRLKNYRPRSLSQAGTSLIAYATLTDAICLEQIAGLTLSGKLKMPMFLDIDDEEEEQMERVLEAVEFIQSAALHCELVEDILDIAGEFEGRALPKDMPLEATAEFFRRVAQANLNQFEKSIVESRAEAQNVTFDKMQNDILVDDLDYLLAWWGTHPARGQIFSRFEGDSLRYAKLGLAIHCYSLSSMLMAKHYSLGMEFDEDDVLVGVKRDASLKYMLDFSEDQVRRHIQSLKAAGVDPSDTIINYMIAGTLRGRDIDSRLYALQYLWEGNVVARTMAYLGGFADAAE